MSLNLDKEFSFYKYVHHRQYKNDTEWHLRDAYFQEMLKSLNFAKNATYGMSGSNPNSGAVSPVKSFNKGSNRKNKVIMLDLDETLVRAEPYIYGNKYAGVISVKVTPDRFQNFGVHVRPFTKEFLEVISKNHRVIVYTASVQEYAEKIVEILDPKRQFIEQVLCRQHCTFIGGMFVKNLNIAVHDDVILENVIIVDNYVHSFALHLDHGIPIKPFYGDMEDRELLHLANVLYLTDDYPRLIDFVRTHFDFSSLYTFLEENDNLFLFTK